jgi:hypothetical protein
MTNPITNLDTCTDEELYLTSPHVTALACALLEVAGAHCLGFPLFPLDLDSRNIA